MNDRHFMNMLMNYLSKKPSGIKLEKFITEKIEQKISEIQVEL